MSKKSGHGSNYLAQPQTIAKHARIPLQIAKDFQAEYFRVFPCIPAWHKNVFWQLENLGYLISPFGRRRFFFGRPKDGSTQRDAVAHVPQSMTADEINKALLNLWRADRVQLLGQVHDSILFQFPEHLRDEIVPWAVEQAQTRLVLERGREFVVPVEAKTGFNWGGFDADNNPDGLKKWGNDDPRKRQETSFQLSLSDF
jgi:DNA polymerase I-like protein with 3'-5' exonuclease and polymerase domains